MSLHLLREMVPRLLREMVPRHVHIFRCLFFIGFVTTSLLSSTIYAQDDSNRSSQRLSMVQLIQSSKAIPPKEHMSWVRKLDSMSNKYKREIRKLLEKERSGLAAIDRRRGHKPPANPKLHGVHVRNNTTSSITISTPGYWFDENGRKIKKSLIWKFTPGESAYLYHGKKRISASKFPYRVEAGSHTYPSENKVWVAYYQSDRGAVVNIDPEDVRRRHVVSKVPFEDKKVDLDQLINQATSIAKDLNEVAQVYNEDIKPVVSVVKHFTRPSFQVTLHSVDVASRKSNDDKWDTGNGRPDIVVRLKVKKFGGDSFRSDIIKNTYWHTFNEEAVRVKTGQDIEITVHDEDAFANDSIGSYRFEVTSHMVERGEINFSFDQVKSVVLHFSE